jgi:hypothetical protein
VVKGEASIITVRGKRKLGYELDIEMSLTEGQLKTKVSLTGLCDDEEDCAGFKMLESSSQTEGAFLQKMKSSRKQMVKSLKEALELYRLSL